MHTMDTRLDETTRQSSQGITGVNRDGPVLRTHPLPLALGVEDLQRGNRLAEEKSEGSQVCMAGAIQIAYVFVDFLAARCVVHVAKVVFAFDIVLMVTDELVFVWELEENGEETEEFLDYFRVAFLCLLVFLSFKYVEGVYYPAEVLDFFQVIHQNGGLLSLMVSIELGDVVYLHVILDTISKAIQSAFGSPFIYNRRYQAYMR